MGVFPDTHVVFTMIQTTGNPPKVGHSGAGRKPCQVSPRRPRKTIVIPAQAGNQSFGSCSLHHPNGERSNWMPAFAGKTNRD
jgi:hypothetical protein